MQVVGALVRLLPLAGGKSAPASSRSAKGGKKKPLDCIVYRSMRHHERKGNQHGSFEVCPGGDFVGDCRTSPFEWLSSLAIGQEHERQ